MAIVLVQHFLGGNVSNTGTTPFTVGTASTNLPQATVSGNLLVIITAIFSHCHSAGHGSGPTASISISGFAPSWSTATGGLYNDATTTNQGAVNIFYVANAPAIPISTTINVTFSHGGSGFTYDDIGEFAFYEFSGVKTTSPVDTTRQSNSATGVPATPNLPTSQPDLILVAYSGNSSNSPAGPLYTLGTTFVAATNAEVQYQIATGSGSVNTSFGSGSQTNYGAGAAAFLPAPNPPPTGTSVNYGYIFG